MRYVRTWGVIFTLVVSGISPAQERFNSLSVFGTFTTSAKLFPSPDDADEFTRGQFLPLNDIFGFGLEFRRDIPAIRVQLGLSIEYLSATELINVPATVISVPVRDGFHAIPIEFTGYFVIPFGGEKIQLFMGAGTGVYLGFRTYDYAGTDAVLISRSVGVGIHVVSGVEYLLSDLLSLRSVIKFRDAQFESTNRFTQPTTVYRGSTIPLSQDLLSSRMNIDGMVATIGIAVRF